MRKNTRLLVTGGAGFIGARFIRYLLGKEDFSGKIVDLDLLSYAASPAFVEGFSDHPRHLFIQGDIRDRALLERIFREHEIDTVIHFAAETHVDRSIDEAEKFFQVNAFGTLCLLETVRDFPHVHFHHISTDEVYGSLGKKGQFFETSPYRPNSPYSASKASADHLVRAFSETYKISTTISHACNNFGPGQYPEKLIPLMIQNCLEKKPLPIYGKGDNVRDWIFVEDHVVGIWEVVKRGRSSESYHIGANCEKTNLEVLDVLIEELKKKEPFDYHSLIHFVEDRKGHDYRYALNTEKIEKELGFKASTPFREGMKKTVEAFLSSRGKTPCFR